MARRHRRPARRSPTRLHGYILGHHSPDHVRAPAGARDRAHRGGRPGRRQGARLRRARGSLRSPWSSSATSRRPGRSWQPWPGGARASTTLAGLARRRARGHPRAAARAARRGRGGWSEAARAWASARRAGTRRSPIGLQLYVLRREQGRLGEVEDLIRRSVAEFPTYPIMRCVHAHVLAELGARDEARATLEALARDRCAALPFDEEWLVSTCLLADAAHRRWVRRKPATVLYELLAPVRRPRRDQLPGGEHRRGGAAPRRTGGHDRAWRRCRAPLRGRARDARPDRGASMASSYRARRGPPARPALAQAVASSASRASTASSRVGRIVKI